MNQATILRRLSGKVRLEQALALSDFVRNLVGRDIKKKKLSQRVFISELARRIRLAHY